MTIQGWVLFGILALFIHIKVCSLKPTLLMYEMMAKEMGISLHCPNYIDISRLRPEKGQKDDAS